MFLALQQSQPVPWPTHWRTRQKKKTFLLPRDHDTISGICLTDPNPSYSSKNTLPDSLTGYI